MKKNKRLDKIIAQALNASIKDTSLDVPKIKRLVSSFKNLPLEDAVYALNAFKKGLTLFEQNHTLTVSAPVELSSVLLSQIKKSLNTKYSILNTQFQIDSSLLAGFKFKIGDEVVDSSLRSSLEALKI